LRIALEEIADLVAVIVVSQIFGQGIGIAGSAEKNERNEMLTAPTKWDWPGYKLAGDS